MSKTPERLTIQKMLHVVKSCQNEKDLSDTGIDYVVMNYSDNPEYCAGYIAILASDGTFLIPFADYDVNAGYEQLMVTEIEADQEEVRMIIQACMDRLDDVRCKLQTAILNV